MRARGVSSYGGVASTIPKIIKKNLATPDSGVAWMKLNSVHCD
jgi:hypothetical protein